jgi:hypothetical protein
MVAVGVPARGVDIAGLGDDLEVRFDVAQQPQSARTTA